ncbi:MAG: FkbM family methyltransferase [Chlorobium sp.]|nr:FkbM family methyltransferase [Chlorobium sp.]
MLKKIVLGLINASGYVVSKNDLNHLCSSLNKFNIDLVLDVGGNKGQFSSSIRRFGYKGDILSFEPLKDAHDQLTKISKFDKKWEVYPRIAVGSHDGKIEINVAGNSVSSSILPMLKSHSDVAKGSEYVGKESVNIITLDTVSKKYLNNSIYPFLKIDTQGYEWEVLDGAKEILPLIKGILCEMSLVELYKGQHLWIDILNRLEKEGFTLWSIQKGFTDTKYGRTLQFDATFFRL